MLRRQNRVEGQGHARGGQVLLRICGLKVLQPKGPRSLSWSLTSDTAAPCMLPTVQWTMKDLTLILDEFPQQMLLGNAQWTLPTCTLRVRASHSNSLKHYPCPISFTPHKHPWEQMSAIISTVILGKKTEAQTDLIIWFEVTYLMTYLNMGSLSPKSKSLALLLYPLRISQNTHISF